MFQENVSGDFGCKRGATERLVWRCIWSSWVIRDAAKEFASSYIVLQHPLWNVHAPVPPLHPHRVFCRLLPNSPWHSLLIYLCTSCSLSPPYHQTLSFLFSLSAFLTRYLEQQEGEKVKREWRCSNFTVRAVLSQPLKRHKLLRRPTQTQSLYSPLHHSTRCITSQLHDY